MGSTCPSRAKVLSGDHNGIPFPFLNVEPRKYRFRMVNTGITRPYMIRLSGALKFTVVASDGGLLEKPVSTDHLRFGVGERWEIVIDFSALAGKEIIMLNADQPSVPMFCKSHLLAKFIVNLKKGPEADLPLPPRFFAVGDFPLNSALVEPARIQEAIATKPENRLTFGHGGTGWSINGVGWADVANRIQITVRPNELSPWHIVNGGGGWFHPVHIHLIDFIVVKRNNVDRAFSPSADPITGLEPYEVGAPKDVVYLAPSEDIEVVARYGPHVGDYMVHCHNLVHEDNDMLVAFRVAGADAGEVPGSPLPSSPAPPNTNVANPMGETAVAYGQLPPASKCLLESYLNRGTYTVFYPPKPLPSTTRSTPTTSGRSCIRPRQFINAVVSVVLRLHCARV
jgi:bilirubin oxidase